MRTVPAAPRAPMLMESMRDIGYSLETALADVVDNSISAAASTIRIFTDGSGRDARIAVADDGEGMSESRLLASMRPGSRSPLEERQANDLGRFGLGLKTASFSRCRRLTVVSRQKGETCAAIWDLGHVAETDEWLVQVPDDPSALPWVEQLAEQGTLVLWENIDRLLDQNGSERGHAEFVRRIDEALEHLELVFHRFLSGERGVRKIRILLNNRPLEPRDPFAVSHPATIAGPIERVKVGAGEVAVQAFTLPHHRKVTPAEWERNAGRAGYLKNQGFYVYREKRLIISGTWFGLARHAELTKLARVRIDIPNVLDSEWKIDVKKASAQPPAAVRDRLRRIIETIGATSKRVYTARGRTLVSKNRLPVWIRVQDKNEIVYRLNPQHPVLADLAERLPAPLKGHFVRVLEVAGSALPMDALFADLGGEPDKVAADQLSEETVREVVSTTARRLQHACVPGSEIVEMLRLAEPFRSQWQLTERILGEIMPEELRSA